MNRENLLRYLLVAVVCVAVVAVYWKIEPYLPLPRTASKSPPAAAKPEAGKPAAEKPAGEKPAGEKPAGEKPAAEKPAGEKPAGEKAPEPPAIKAAVLQAVGATEAAPAIILGSAKSDSPFDLEAEVTPVGAAVRRLAMSRRDFFKTVADARKPSDERAPMELVDPAAP
ncbi:MAG: hypothetical protein NT049_02055, partial [Planctomycetota bacterium]|nr:hypothetical protein [Planctomycetota bacterium]